MNQPTGSLRRLVGMRGRAMLRVLALGLAAGLALSACDSGSSPKAAPTVSARSSPTTIASLTRTPHPVATRLRTANVVPCGALPRKRTAADLVLAYRASRLRHLPVGRCVTAEVRATYCPHGRCGVTKLSPGPMWLYACGDFKVVSIQRPLAPRAGQASLLVVMSNGERRIERNESYEITQRGGVLMITDADDY